MTGRFPRGSLSPKCRLSISQLTRSEWAVIVHFFFYQFQFTRRRDWFLKIKLTPIDSPSSALQFWFWLRGHQTEGSATKWRKLRVVSAIYRHLNALRQCAIQQLSSEWMKWNVEMNWNSQVIHSLAGKYIRAHLNILMSRVDVRRVFSPNYQFNETISLSDCHSAGVTINRPTHFWALHV